MLSKTENLPLIGLFISIFIAIIMGFVIGALVENLVLKDINSDIEKILEQPTKISIINSTIAAEYYARLIVTEPLIVGFNIIDLNDEIVYSDEISLVGKTFSEKAKILKAIKNKNYYTVDRNLISQETILKEDYKSLLILFYHFEDIGVTIQILYDISPKEKDIRQITSLLWFTILLSVGVLFFLLVFISTLTRRNLQKAKENLEMEIIKRTKALQKLSTDLDRQVKERTKDLESANKELVKKSMNLTETTGQLDDKNYELQQANKEILNLMEARTEFINKAAHDLRTPITPILVLIPTIKKRIKDIDILFDLKVIERNANYLKNIADNLISYLKSKSQKYNYNFKKTDIRKLIEDVLITYRETFKQRKISVIKKFSGNLPLIGLDRLKITEVIQNIVSNALKFMPRVGKLTISVKKMDNFINVGFKDTGIGIKKEALEEIFKEFFKADVARHTEGQGLGLSICKGIIEDHHGKIWAESNGHGKGSTMSFNIPITQKKVRLYEKENKK